MIRLIVKISDIYVWWWKSLFIRIVKFYLENRMSMDSMETSGIWQIHYYAPRNWQYITSKLFLFICLYVVTLRIYFNQYFKQYWIIHWHENKVFPLATPLLYTILVKINVFLYRISKSKLKIIENHH